MPRLLTVSRRAAQSSQRRLRSVYQRLMAELKFIPTAVSISDYVSGVFGKRSQDLSSAAGEILGPNCDNGNSKAARVQQSTLAPVQVRTLFLSDLHLGATSSRPDLVLAFLKRHRAQTYYLVGDILDLLPSAYQGFSRADMEVLAHLRARREEGAEIVYLVGNHDPAPSEVLPAHLLPAEPLAEIIHHTADGRRFLVVHGDTEDRRLFRLHLLTRSFSLIDRLLRRLDACIGAFTNRASPTERSFVEFILSWTNWLLYPTRAHERRLMELARNKQADGIICGHFHIAALNNLHGLTYANCGDWIDSFTALAENMDGTLNLLGGRHALANARAHDLSLTGALA